MPLDKTVVHRVEKEASLKRQNMSCIHSPANTHIDNPCTATYIELQEVHVMHISHTPERR